MRRKQQGIELNLKSDQNGFNSSSISSKEILDSFKRKVKFSSWNPYYALIETLKHQRGNSHNSEHHKEIEFQSYTRFSRRIN